MILGLNPINKYFISSALSLFSTLIFNNNENIALWYFAIYVIAYFIVMVLLLIIRKFTQLKILKNFKISFFGIASYLELLLFFILEFSFGDNSSVSQRLAMLNRMIFLYFRFFLVNKLIVIKKRQISLITILYVANILIYYFLNEKSKDLNNLLSIFFGVISVTLNFFIIKLTNIEEIYCFFYEILRSLNQSFLVVKEGKINKLIYLQGKYLQSLSFKKCLSKKDNSDMTFLNEIFLVEKKKLSENCTNLDFDSNPIIENEDYVKLDFEKYIFLNNSMKNRTEIIKLNVKFSHDTKKSFVLVIKRFSIKKQNYFIFILNKLRTEKDPNSSIIKNFSSKLSKIKDSFSELTPLLELLSFSEKISEDKHNPYKLALTNLKLTIRKVDNLIYYEMIKANSILLSPSKIRIFEFLQELIQTIRPLANYRKLKFKIAIEESLLKLEIKTDSAMLKQIILNLFSNAIKFTSYQGVIHLKVTLDEENQKIINFSFNYSGVGFDEKQLEDLDLILNKERNNIFDEKITFNFFSLYIANSLLKILSKNQYLKIEISLKQETKITFSLDCSSQGEMNFNINENITDQTKSHSFFIEEENKKIIEEEDTKISFFKNSNLIDEENKKQLTSFKNCSLFENNSSNLLTENKKQPSSFKNGSLIDCTSSNFLTPLPFMDKNLKRNSDVEINTSTSTKLDSLNKFRQNSSSLLKDINYQSCILNNCECRQCLFVDYDSNTFLPLRFIFNSLKLTYSILNNNNNEAIHKVLQQKDCTDTDCQGLRLILINCQSPLQETIDTIAQLKETLEQCSMKVPLIGTMSLINKEEMNQCLDAGLNDFIFNPVTLKTIKNCLSKWTTLII